MITEIRAHLAALTPGEWSREWYEDGEEDEGPYGVHPGSAGPMVESNDIVVYEESGELTHVADDVSRSADAAFLAKAPEYVRRLLAVVDALPRCEAVAGCGPATRDYDAPECRQLLCDAHQPTDPLFAEYPYREKYLNDLPHAAALRALLSEAK